MNPRILERVLCTLLISACLQLGSFVWGMFHSPLLAVTAFLVWYLLCGMTVYILFFSAPIAKGLRMYLLSILLWPGMLFSSTFQNKVEASCMEKGYYGLGAGNKTGAGGTNL